jgi:hypothetical protein
MMPNRSRVNAAVLAAVALAVAAPAAAAPRSRICVFGVKGDGGAALVEQLSGALCDDFDCVAPEDVRTGGKLDFAAVQSRGVAAVLFGTASRSGKSPRLALALLTTSFTPQRTWTLPLDARGRADARALTSFSSELRDELVGSAQPPPHLQAIIVDREPVAQRAPAAIASPVATPPAPPAPPARGGAIADTPAGQRRDQLREPVPDPAARWAAVDLGVAYAHRELSYSGAVPSSGTLLGFRAGAVLSPAVRAEVSPLLGATGRWYQGATAYAGYSRSLGQYTQSPSGSNKATAFSHLEVGAGLRYRPVAAWRARVLADLSYQAVAVKVSPRGAIPGLPDVDLSGARAGLSLEAPLFGRYTLLAGGGLTYWLRARDLVGGSYFSSGTVLGLDASGGVEIALRGPFSARLLVDWAQTRYWLTTTSTLHAHGATDTSLGGRVLARAAF